MWACGDYRLPGWVGPGSWGNNQTPGTVAFFLGKGGWPILDTSTAPSFNHVYDWTPVWIVSPC
ncbi:hypothetical protein [Amycolatopsis anabasis]|uniref:hypothetical protein n=1 Tax=Amycolatopsis anabasis TaxID=1840409 RepID=UPI00131DFE3B|nr:hypothetical protein [Amycolatopsis anabasis]